MSRFLSVIVFLALLGLSGPMPVHGERVAVIPLKGEVSEAQFLFLRRALKDAVREDAKAVVLDLNTHGGSYAAVEKMQKALEKVSVPTYTYVNPNAASAGALLAVSTRHIYMSPVSAIGAAAPVNSDGQDLPKTLELKHISYSTDFFRSVAEANGHNPAVVEAFINKDKEVKIGDRVIHEKGAPLTLSAKRATEVIDGKPLLAVGIADSVEDLLRQAGIPDAQVVTIAPMGFETAAFWITRLAPLLLLGGIAGAWMEMKTPGFGVAGVLSLISFGFFFFGHFVAGLAGWEMPVVFVIGLILVLVELLVLPGVLVPGLIGAVLMAGAIFWAMVDRFPGTSWIPSGEAFLTPVVNLGITAILVTIAGVLIAKYLPKTRVYRRFVLEERIDASAVPQPDETGAMGLAVGSVGKAVSDLRPSGSAEFEGKRFDVVSLSGYVDAGTEVEVVTVEAFRIEVKARGEG